MNQHVVTIAFSYAFVKMRQYLALSVPGVSHRAAFGTIGSNAKLAVRLKQMRARAVFVSGE